jgi:hypothetical protein
MTTLLDHALSYCRPVLPLRPRGKAPLGHLVPHGYLDASADPGVLRSWWHPEPSANIGLVTGTPLKGGGRLAVLDVDYRHDGPGTLERLEAAAGRRLPTTVEVETGAGRHHYFRGPGWLRCQRLADGLDLRAAGGYVVAPPSIHPCGAPYGWAVDRAPGQVPLATFPAWLLPDPPARPDGDGRRDADDALQEIPPTEYVPALTGRTPDRRGYVTCPFHADGQERTPSLKVYPTVEGGWWCYGCGIGGGIYQLAALVGGYPLPPRGRDFLIVRDALLDHFERRAAA